MPLGHTPRGGDDARLEPVQAGQDLDGGRCRLGVAHQRLHREDPLGASEELVEEGRLGAVALGRPGAVGVQIGDVAPEDTGVVEGSGEGPSDLGRIGGDGNGVVAVGGHGPAEHPGVSGLGTTGDHHGHRRLAGIEAAAAFLEGTADVPGGSVDVEDAQIAEGSGVFGRARQVGGDDDDIGGDPGVDPHLGGQEAHHPGGAHGGEVHARGSRTPS